VTSVLNPRTVNLRFNRLVCFDTKGTEQDGESNTAYIALCKSIFFKNPFGLLRARRGADTSMNLWNTLQRGKLNAIKDSTSRFARIFPREAAREGSTFNPRYDLHTILCDYFNARFYNINFRSIPN